MFRTSILTPMVGVAFLALSLAPADAEACSCGFGCANELIVGQALPKNAPGIPWWFEAKNYSPAPRALEKRVELVRLGRSGAKTPVDVRVERDTDHGVWLIVPEESWRIDAVYQVGVHRIQPNCRRNSPVRTAQFRAVGAVQGARNLGLETDAVERRRISLSHSGGGCSSAGPAGVRNVRPAHATETELVSGAMMMEMFVDGQRYRPYPSLCAQEPPGSSLFGRNTHQLIVACEGAYLEGDALLEPGAHRVEMRASLPGTDIEFDTRPVNVRVYCPESGKDERAGCRAAGGRTGAGWSAIVALVLVRLGWWRWSQSVRVPKSV